jgi:hypothetical protein
MGEAKQEKKNTNSTAYSQANKASFAEKTHQTANQEPHAIDKRHEIESTPKGSFA